MTLLPKNAASTPLAIFWARPSPTICLGAGLLSSASSRRDSIDSPATLRGVTMISSNVRVGGGISSFSATHAAPASP